MKRLLKLAVGAFAAVGVAYTAMMLYVYFALPNCTFISASEVWSPDEKYSADFEQTRCEDPARSRSTVGMRALERSERIVWLKIDGTNDVTLTWNGNREPVVRLPSSANFEKYGPYDGWPRVVEQRVPLQTRAN